MYGVAYRVLAPEAGTYVVVPQGCKINGVYCSTVGKTDLPTDPTPPEPEVPPPPVVYALDPAYGSVNAPVNIIGTGFGATQGAGKVQFGAEDAVVTAWADTAITVTAPAAAGTYPVTVTTDAGVASNASIIYYASPPSPAITDITPASGPDQTEITINGSAFGATQGAGWVVIGVELAVIISWSDTQIVAAAVQNAQDLDVAYPVQVQNTDGQQGALDASFTFTIAAARGSSKAAKKTSKRSKDAREDEKERPRAEAKAAGTFPTFDSGGGFMLTEMVASGGKIMVGPTELHEGQLYPLELWCMRGLEVVVNAPCDLTFLVAPQ